MLLLALVETESEWILSENKLKTLLLNLPSETACINTCRPLTVSQPSYIVAILAVMLVNFLGLRYTERL